MKYAFKSQPNQNVIEMELTSFQIVIHQQGKERVIPYSAITDVRLECKKGLFFTTIQSLDFGSIQLSNRSVGESGKWEDQSRQYHTFVRVLHHHLMKTHCPAEFCAGFKPSHLSVKFMVLILVAALFYFVEEYFNIFHIHPLLVVLIVSGIGTLIILSPFLKNPPKSYNPSDIPLNMLPPAS